MNWFKKHKVLTVILIFVVFIIVGAAASPKDKTRTQTTTKPAATQTTQPKQPAWDAQAIYDQITAGMTRAQAEQIIGKGSGSCTESATPGVGTMEICNYTGGLGSKGTISVDYLNDAVYTKTKLDF